MSKVILLGGPHHGTQLLIANEEQSAFESVNTAGTATYHADGQRIAGFRLAYPAGYGHDEKRAAMQRWLKDLRPAG